MNQMMEIGKKQKKFYDVNANDLAKKKDKRLLKKLSKKLELIINLSTTNYKKPIYVKCLEKKLIMKRKNKYILYS